MYQYHNYRKSFDKIVPYSHTMETYPTEFTSQTETIPETQPQFETITTNFTASTTEIIMTSTFFTTTSTISTKTHTTKITSTTAIPQPIDPIQEELVPIPDETELIVNYPLNLNTATFEELCTLPEIGEVLAQAILDYRDEIGGFINREQLLKISGIGQYRYSAIAPLLMIENEQPL